MDSNCVICSPHTCLPVQDGDNGRGSGVTVLLTGATGLIYSNSYQRAQGKRYRNLGYGESKWLAEEICEKFSKVGWKNIGLKISQVEINVLRIGQLCGALETRVWNKTEYWSLLIAGYRFTGCLPLLDWIVLILIM
ncbi:uncharacterized protein MELLADRAFT_103745 [Melampsora larici-populina 98AG31]|uniref:Uncharacterized protein n=1 Tax=Melampsora larici-populina (strain 98AG31 / pathotype 3-4-7) TaxID=747676 RepID=F4RC85_MELLP|nr:uncharacterized protein MELLADRAFT_103745 [Melampsora larici-populina 98AG31]EGG09997.1 hypothetical protein MELLADRAFT_103745 [Melampsora larici-populina 98AG31]